MASKASLFTRPDGRLRAAFVVPAILLVLVVFAIAWQTWQGPS